MFALIILFDIIYRGKKIVYSPTSISRGYCFGFQAVRIYSHDEIPLM